MKDIAEAICIVAVLAFLAFTMPTCAGCGEWGPSPANAGAFYMATSAALKAYPRGGQ